MINNINVRFFTYCINENELNEIDICEITENQFLELTVGYENDNLIHYERHTMRENGVSQICLTVEPIEAPYFDELERV